MPLAFVGGCGNDDGNDSTTAATLAPATLSDTSNNGSDSSGSGGASTGNEDADTTAGMTTEPTADSSSGGGPVPEPACGHQCASAADCMVEGNDIGLDCLSGLCGIACTDDDYCIAASSGWLIVSCTGDGDCEGGACVDIGNGAGGCSFVPAQGNCADVGLVQMQWPAIGGGMITVCGQPNGRCGDFDGTAACFVGCEPGGCGDMTCEDDGRCHCDFDLHCVEAGLGNNCNSDGLCEIACQQASDCPATGFDGGTVVCE
ncbi:MAG: hypothetical protein AAGF11_24435 [Myxococcota bacterium]